METTGVPMLQEVLGDRGRVFLDEDGERWTAARILSLAGRIARAVEATDSGTVGVCSPSAAFLVASTLALWKLGRAPLLLDPSLRRAPDAVLGDTGMPVLAPVATPAMARLTVVSEGDGKELDPTWPADQHPAVRFLTSGSTGEPKLVTKRGYQFSRQAVKELPWLGFSEGARVFSLVAPFHILGFMYGVFAPLVRRGSTAFTRGSTPEVWARFIRDQRPDVVVGVPSHYRFLAKSLDGPLPSACYLSSGAPLPPTVDHVFRDTAGARIIQIYGSTETGGVARRVGTDPWEPFPGVSWSLAPKDGRLRVLSPWQEDPDTWYISDDVAEDAGEGFRLLGRADSIVKVGGKRFSTQEVVAAAQALPGVDTALIVVSQRPFGEDGLTLFATPAGPGRLTSAELRAALRAALPPFKVPRTILILDNFPYLSTGKVDLQSLRRIGGSLEGGEGGGGSPAGG